MFLSSRLGRLKLSIRTWMALLTLLAVLPLLAFSLTATYRLLSEHQAASEVDLQDRTKAAATAIGRRMQNSLTTVQTMVLSTAALTGDLERLYVQALGVAHADSEILSISVSNSQGEQLFNTSAPFGVPLPPTQWGDIEKPVFLEGKPVVAPLSTGSVNKTLIVGVAVPVRVDDMVAYSLRLVLRPHVIESVLSEQQWPGAWSATVLDQNNIIVARNREGEHLIGSKAPPDLQQAIAQGRRDVFEAVIENGTLVKANVVAVPGTGWHVVGGVPKARLMAEVRESLLVLLTIGVCSMVMSVGGSMLLAQNLSAHIRQFARASLGETDPAHLAAANSAIREISLVSQALSHAKGSATRAEGALHAARHDALTGLAGRALFLEQAASLQQGLTPDGQSQLSILYMDLDGFKWANDTLGHEAGDRILKAVADVIRSCVRDGDALGRLGGDEFGVCIVAPTDRIQVISRHIAERIVAGVGRIGNGIGCSVGMARGDLQSTLSGIIDRADQAMLRAKRSGKGQVMDAPHPSA